MHMTGLLGRPTLPATWTNQAPFRPWNTAWAALALWREDRFWRLMGVGASVSIAGHSMDDPETAKVAGPLRTIRRVENGST